MQWYAESLTTYQRLLTREVKIGDLLMGNGHPIRVQTMTTTDTLDTAATAAQAIRCIEAGAELIRITAPSKKEAENLAAIKKIIREKGYTTPLVADIHFTPNAAELAARIVEKVRVNPGNYVDKKKFELIEYTDADYQEELDRIRERFTPLVKICKEYGTALRIGTNHGSLSDRIMSRYGDTPIGMVESALEFLRIARDEGFHNIVLSMKSSNPQVMVQAYRLLIQSMHQEFKSCYPLHLGVTEAGDGEDGRVKSAIGIGTLLEDGIGDTIRVSLTEDPEFEIPVCQDLVQRYTPRQQQAASVQLPPLPSSLPYNPFAYARRKTFPVLTIGGSQVPVVIADWRSKKTLHPEDFVSIGYTYDPSTDKWMISETAADFILTGSQIPNFGLPGTLQVIADPDTWATAPSHSKIFPLFTREQYIRARQKSDQLNFVWLDGYSEPETMNVAQLEQISKDRTVVFIVSSKNSNVMQSIRRRMIDLQLAAIQNPVILLSKSSGKTPDEHLIHFSAETGALLLDGWGDGLCLSYTPQAQQQSSQVSGRTYLPVSNSFQFTNNTAFSILQAARTRISKTEYISCPSCGRTLFDLQETTARIRAVTHHLKGVKIAIMGCIVNGPGEMADADFGYVGSGPGKITLYKGKEIVKRNVDSAIAVEELIRLLKENNVWVEPKASSVTT